MSSAPHLPDPVSWRLRAKTLDGAEYVIRPIRPDDAEREREFIAGLSAESRRSRFLHMLRDPPRELIDQFVRVDYRRTMAFVAVLGAGADERIIGVARYFADADGEGAEFAVTVADAWQGHGIGAALMSVLLDYARSQGVRRVQGVILADNAQMLQLAQWLGMQIRRLPEEPTLCEASMRLDAGDEPGLSCGNR